MEDIIDDNDAGCGLEEALACNICRSTGTFTICLIISNIPNE
jgi:hypothetical protein